jgi:NifU-like protein involved in Fe-S cluster formation
MNAARLYTPEVLALAAALGGLPSDEGMPFRGSTRSASCGSMVSLGLSLDVAGRIDRIGLRAQACAIGQAAAAIFAGSAQGQSRAAIEQGYGALTAWLEGDGPMPDWPGLAAIAAVTDYPARHGAVLLAWKAALDMLPTDAQPG